ncbi:balbiani ring protein 3-like [Harpegnathos saltator]|uniref:balbiani ring protein 3-like n=1 Tax=Harpegnathos saltator TaxID=610380 RepID=UPI0005914DF6|nr:balbiani ring protein 3-like [Harpegnathos saltator]
MRSSLILLCAVMLVWWSSGNIAAHRYDNEYNELRAHDGESTDCSGKSMRLSHQMRGVKCEPRETMVKLVPQLGSTFFPNYARVKRCSGFCTKSKACMPVMPVNLTKVAVRIYGFKTKGCYNVLVEEHIRCKCLCSVQPFDCNAHQRYSKDNCSCECMNRQSCDASRHMVWDEKTCKCTCTKPEELCSSGLEWVHSRCRCAKVMDMMYEDN